MTMLGESWRPARGSGHYRDLNYFVLVCPDVGCLVMVSSQRACLAYSNRALNPVPVRPLSLPTSFRYVLGLWQAALNRKATDLTSP